jgi:hypothetical protein
MQRALEIERFHKCRSRIRVAEAAKAFAEIPAETRNAGAFRYGYILI